MKRVGELYDNLSIPEKEKKKNNKTQQKQKQATTKNTSTCTLLKRKLVLHFNSIHERSDSLSKRSYEETGRQMLLQKEALKIISA